MNKLWILIVVVLLGLAIYFYANKSDDSNLDSTAAVDSNTLISRSPAGADVFIIEPGHNTTVTSPVTVKFGIANMEVAPAGTDKTNSGHHHLLIDLDTMPSLTEPLPATDNLIHFGAGQTETIIDLEPGTHTLQLLLGNYLHIPHSPPVVSKKITITVE